MNKTKHYRPIIQEILSIFLLSILLTTTFAITANASELVILYSNDIRGDTEPCG